MLITKEMVVQFTGLEQGCNVGLGHRDFQSQSLLPGLQGSNAIHGPQPLDSRHNSSACYWAHSFPSTANNGILAVLHT